MCKLCNFSMQTLQLNLMLADLFLHRQKKLIVTVLQILRNCIAPAILGVELSLSRLLLWLHAAVHCSLTVAWQLWPKKSHDQIYTR